jgi:hypothetical protein
MAQSLNFFGVLILSLISCSVAQVEIPEGCRDLPVVQNFDIPSVSQPSVYALSDSNP